MKRFIQTDGRHRALERMVPIFTVLVFASVLVGGLVEFIPLVLVKSNIPKIESVKPFTPLEVLGRDLYIAEGCNTCHSQMVRPFRDEVERYGEYSKPGETVYETPFLWGSKRTGPDLARVGGKYPDLWHIRHMENPRSTSPKSVMPRYPYMLTKQADLASIPQRLKTLQRLGIPYTDEEIAGSVAHAEAQAAAIAERVEASGGPTGLADKQVVALTAFLQRLGQDIKQPTVAQATDHPAAPAPDVR